jgi:acetyl esterase/lipase
VCSGDTDSRPNTLEHREFAAGLRVQTPARPVLKAAPSDPYASSDSKDPMIHRNSVPAFFSLALLSALAACSANFESAAEQQALLTPSNPVLIPGTTPAPDCGSTQYTLSSGVAYASGAGHLLDVYVPKAGNAPRPLVIWVHGGGWQSGDRTQVLQMKRMACHGYAVASIDYRLSTAAKFPAQAHDVKGAIRFLRANATQFGVDPDKFALAGSSAGGHLAAVAGLSSGVPSLEGTLGNATISSKVQAIVDWYGPTDLSKMDAQLAAQGFCPPSNHGSADSPEGKLLGCAPSATTCAAQVTRANPLTYADSSDPPTLILHGERDCTSPLAGSEALSVKLRDAGALVRFQVVQGAEHGGPEWVTAPVQDAVSGFLDEVFAAPPTPVVDCSAFKVTGDARSANGATWIYTSTDEGVAYSMTGALFQPAASAGKQPGVVLNHGRNASPVSFWRAAGTRLRGWGLNVIAPQLTHSDANTPALQPAGGDGASTANVLRAHKARDLLSCVNVDMTRVGVYGHSMGAFATGQLLGTFPTSFKAAAHTAGGAGTGINLTKPDVAAKIRTPYQFHHGKDDAVVNYSADVELDRILTASGSVHDFRSYEAMNHDLIRINDIVFTAVQAWYRTHGLIP